MREPFGKRNRKFVSKPANVKSARRRSSGSPPASSNSKLYFYIIGGVVFLVLAGYAFAT
jgi:hypothetical protein